MLRAPQGVVLLSGNLGTGKTSVAQLIGESTDGVEVFVEMRAPSLDDFYRAPEKWAFEMQLWYTNQALRQAELMATSTAKLIVQDRNIYDTHDMFSQMRWEEGLISDAEFRILSEYADQAKALLSPTLLVLLDASPAESYRRVKLRNDPLEGHVTIDTLTTIRERYKTWFQAFNLCPKALISTDDMSIRDVCEVVLNLSAD